MLSPIQLTPNMDMATLTTTINDMFRQIESENRTQIKKDENGVNRILIGRTTNGKYVMAITAPGKDVVEETGK